MWTDRRSGKHHKRSQHDHRLPFERDRTRVIHCPAFRRLQRKTQILGTDEGDFHRTRLTHSLEVSSIASSLVKNLTRKHPDQKSLIPDIDLISCISLLHDIGHPPFGHGGEVALNYMMRNHGGFESNAQTLRLLTKLENSYGNYGLDLTRRTLLGILKYPVSYSSVLMKNQPQPDASTISRQIRVNDWIPPKAYFDSEQPEVDWLLSTCCSNDKTLFQSLLLAPSDCHHGKSRFKSLDCSIMDLADDIAYGVHDLEDAIHLKLLLREQLDTQIFHDLLCQSNFCTKQQTSTFIEKLFHPDAYQQKLAIGAMVNYFITQAELVISDKRFEQHLFRFNAQLPDAISALLNYLQQCIYQYVIDSQESRTFEYGGQTVVLRLFEAINSNPESLLDPLNRKKYSAGVSDEQRYRVICDYIANMTDEYAYRMHERLFGFNTRTIFERL